MVNSSLCYPSITAVPNRPNSKAWSYDFKWNGSEAQYCLGWAPTPLYMGKIMFPMAEFVYMVKVEFANDLQNTPPVYFLIT